MKKTSLYLDPELDRTLARRAEREGITKADLIRRTLAAAVDGEQRPKLVGRGVFEGPGDLGENVDRYLAEWGFGRD